MTLQNNQDGENVPPVNNFHKTLLSVKADEVHKPQTEKPQRTALLPIQPANNEPPATSLSTTSAPSLAMPQSSLLPPLSPLEHNQLSIIAEDDEPSERAHLSNSVHDAKVMGPPISLPECPALPCPADFENSTGNETQEQSSAVSDADTFHSIPLTSLDSKLQDETISQVFDTEKMVVDIDPDPTEEEGQQVDDVDDHMTSSSQQLSEKPLPPTFPTLPDPVPLRKSIRIRDPSMNTNMLGVATPGAATAKRTSWLSKAREAKALEGTVKKTNIPSIPPMPPLHMTLASAFLPQGKKRKSGEMLDGTRPTEQEDERIQKIAKLSEVEIAPRRSKENASVQVALKRETAAQRDEFRDANTSQGGVLDMLKKTVEGLGARTNKTMGRSLGGNAASILAEAKAAAEARLAARDRKKEESTSVMNDTAAPAKLIVSKDKDVDMAPSTSAATPHGGRLSVSDLFPREGRVKEKHRSPEKVFQKPILPLILAKEADSNQQRTSTTPPHSPPAQPATLVFTKPVPVFVPPVPALSKPASPIIQEASFRPPSPKYFVPSSIVSGLVSHLESSPKGKASITAQSSLQSLHSETIFDNDNGPAWMPGTQDTEYTTPYGSQSQQAQICDEDDSWPVDEKLAAGVQWTYGASKEDSMTWSTLPSQSQRGDTGPVTVREDEDAVSHHNPTYPDVEMENEKDLISRDTELEEIVLGCKSTVSLVQVSSVIMVNDVLSSNHVTQQPDSTQSQTQFSLASSGSSQSQVGFLGQASKFLSNALGTGKRKPEVKKVLQMAAVAAKKVRFFSPHC